ncbi:hypothetical protein EYF80_023105 [Liparis tanakae]|uniref:Uncharacterized protein n=1 Tax=Liparis tanakae TaxID=230148 RepID=A0A4Z2HLL3_9TELE|nr:hypothetical protein EYF80_023105 [Liparis tanakae]
MGFSGGMETLLPVSAAAPSLVAPELMPAAACITTTSLAATDLEYASFGSSRYVMMQSKTKTSAVRK